MAGRRQQKSALAGRRPRPAQRGAALLIFLIIAVTAALTYVVTNLTPEAVEMRRAQKTQEALVLAREALIGHALRHRESKPEAMYGYLPLPDLGSSRNQNVGCTQEGCDANTFTGAIFDVNGIGPSVVGRLPWRTLGVEPIRDGHGECLWLMVSALHGRIHRSAPPPVLPPMNWDTLGQFDIVVANGSAALASVLDNAHERPVAVIFSPGPPLPGQNRGNPGGNDVSRCGGNYDARNYLDPANATALVDVTNYLAGTHHASGATGDSDPANDPDTPKKLSIQGGIFASGGNFLPDACQGSGCTQLANDRGMALTGEQLFAAIRKHAHFRTDINSMLDRMVNCLRDQPPVAGTAERIPENTCYDRNQHPLGYFDHYRDQVFLARPADSLNVNGDAGCTAALLFAGQRQPGQQRVTAAQQNDINNYLEGGNATDFAEATAAFAGDALFDRSPPQAAWQDIVRCIPSGATFDTVESTTLAALGVGQLVAYDTATRTLILGRENVVTGVIGSGNAGALFGCAWTDSRSLGGGLRAYFTFRFKRLGTNVGFNGFVFALADAESNGSASCGAAGSHLGYSGDNGSTPMVAWPKIGIEFDQGRNPGFPGSGGETSMTAGRNDPCGTTAIGCAGFGYNSHAAIVYWGNDAQNAADLVDEPDFDDNVHGFPANPPATRPPPTTPPYPSPGFAFKDLRGKTDEGGDSYLYHARVEITPTRAATAAAEDSSTVVQTQVWLLADSTMVANQIAAMRNTTRPMSLLYPGLAPHLQDTATLYDVGTDRGDCANCQSGEACGTDNICYRQALRTLRPGFTGAQRTTDQEVHISDFFTTWIP